ncbi:IS110 family transposase [Hwanghaeella sp.]|uniref:IS110 family transposase n=1 Tax=Hwanghaeella sp. TaxID=2605943 RepID=UPI003CCBD906
MSSIAVIGLDIAKRVFQVHGSNTSGAVLERRQLRRSDMLSYFGSLEPCLIGIEACATAHFWGRELQALGHDVRLIPPQYVKPYVKRNKTDAADAEAICEAVTRPGMHFVPVKTAEQQAVLSLHRIRDRLVRQRTMTGNALRGHMAEFGIVEAQGIAGTKRLAAIVEDGEDARLPTLARRALMSLVRQFYDTVERIEELGRELTAWHKKNETSRRLASMPGIGPILASALVASVPDPSVFASARQFAAWLGLVPRQHSTGGKARLGGISKRGDGYLRRLLVTGATAALFRSKEVRTRPWVRELLKRRSAKVVAVALANKMARIAWALMRDGAYYAKPA